MRSLFPALAIAAFASLPAAAQVSVQVRADRGGVDVYFDAMEAGVPAPWLYEQATTRHGRSALPAPGTFAYFGAGAATYAAVVTDVWPDGTVTLEHATPMGRMAFRMNLRRPGSHRHRGAIVNDYVSFAGPTLLASRAFYGYALPPPRAVVVQRIHHHRGHRGYAGPRAYRDPPRSSCLPAGHPGRGRAHGLCRDRGRQGPDVIVVQQGKGKGKGKHAKRNKRGDRRAPPPPRIARW